MTIPYKSIQEAKTACVIISFIFISFIFQFAMDDNSLLFGKTDLGWQKSRKHLARIIITA